MFLGHYAQSMVADMMQLLPVVKADGATLLCKVRLLLACRCEDDNSDVSLNPYACPVLRSLLTISCNIPISPLTLADAGHHLPVLSQGGAGVPSGPSFSHPADTAHI
jgi:hypothetical protein